VINKICSETSERIAYSINQGVLPVLVQAFNSNNENVVEQVGPLKPFIIVTTIRQSQQ